MIKSFKPNAAEVRAFRERIFREDLGVEYTLDKDFSKHENKFLYWYGDNKFIYDKGFDEVLLYYVDGEAVSMVCGTQHNENLYRTTQMYYVLNKYKRTPGMNTFHFRPDGFFDWQINRARELGCKGAFIAIDLFDKRHEIMYNAMKNDVVGAGHMPNTERKYTAKDFQYLDTEYEIMHTSQKIIFYPLVDGVEFGELYNG